MSEPRKRRACAQTDCNQNRSHYEVGYGKPPKHSRFQPGQSGNPKGRPPGSKNFSTLINHELDSTMTVREGGRVIKLTKREIVAKQLVKKSMEGDHRGQQILLKFDQQLAASEQSANGNGPPADAPLEPDDRAILDAFAAMLIEGAAGAIAVDEPDPEGRQDGEADDGALERGS